MKTGSLRCDYCGEIITKPQEGIFEFISERDPDSGEKRCREFYIVHQAGASPLYRIGLGGQSCYHNHKEKGFSDIGIGHILDGGTIEVLSQICPLEMENGDEKLQKIIDRLIPLE